MKSCLMFALMFAFAFIVGCETNEDNDSGTVYVEVISDTQSEDLLDVVEVEADQAESINNEEVTPEVTPEVKIDVIETIDTEEADQPEWYCENDGDCTDPDVTVCVGDNYNTTKSVCVHNVCVYKLVDAIICFHGCDDESGCNAEPVCASNDDCTPMECYCTDGHMTCMGSNCWDYQCYDYVEENECTYGCDGDHCAGPQCLSNFDCDDEDPCTTNNCHEYGFCYFVTQPDCHTCQDDTDCDDSNMCTQNLCNNGMCEYVPVGVTPEYHDICNDDNHCTEDYCSFVLGECVYSPVCDEDTVCLENSIDNRCYTACENHGDCDDDNSSTNDFCVCSDNTGEVTCFCGHEEEEDSQFCNYDYECADSPWGPYCVRDLMLNVKLCQECSPFEIDTGMVNVGCGSLNPVCAAVSKTGHDGYLLYECEEDNCASGCDDGNPCTEDHCVPWANECEFLQDDSGCDEGWSCFPKDEEVFDCRIVCEEDDECEQSPFCDGDIAMTFNGGCHNSTYCNMQMMPCYFGCTDGVCLQCEDDVHCDDNNLCTNDFCMNGFCDNEHTDDLCLDGYECIPQWGSDVGFACEIPCESNDECSEKHACQGDFTDNVYSSCDDGYCSRDTHYCEFGCMNGVCLQCDDDSHCNDGDSCTYDLCIDGFCEIDYDDDPCYDEWTCFPSDGENFKCKLLCEDNEDCLDSHYCDGNGMAVNFEPICTSGHCQYTTIPCQTGCTDGNCHECETPSDCHDGQPGCKVYSCEEGFCSDVTMPDCLDCDTYKNCPEEGTTACGVDSESSQYTYTGMCLSGKCQKLSESCYDLGCSNGGCNECAVDNDCDSFSLCGCYDDTFVCSWESCQNGKCEEMLTDIPCEYGCSLNGDCNETCVDNSQCDDNDPCSYDYCKGGIGCEHESMCAAGVCNVIKGDSVECVHECENHMDCEFYLGNNPCSVKYCDLEGYCRYNYLDGRPCDDGDPCTGNDQCSAGLCNFEDIDASCEDFHGGGCSHGLNDCDDGDDCTLDTCYDPSGACLHETIWGCRACQDTEDCNENESCFNNEFCMNGSNGCSPNNEDMCPEGQYCMDNECHFYPCQEDWQCDDGTACTQDFCEFGRCQNAKVSGDCLTCSEHLDCDLGTPGHFCSADGNSLMRSLNVCDQNNGMCYLSDVAVCQYGCEDGECLPAPCLQDSDCDNGDPCTDDSCEITCEADGSCNPGFCHSEPEQTCELCSDDVDCENVAPECSLDGSMLMVFSNEMCVDGRCSSYGKFCEFNCVNDQCSLPQCYEDNGCSTDKYCFNDENGTYVHQGLGECNSVRTCKYEFVEECLMECNDGQCYCESSDQCADDNDPCTFASCMNNVCKQVDALVCVYPSCDTDDDCSDLNVDYQCQGDVYVYNSWRCSTSNQCEEVISLVNCQYGCGDNGECSGECQTDDQCNDGNDCTIDKCYTNCNFGECFNECQNNSLGNCCTNPATDCVPDDDPCTTAVCMNGACGSIILDPFCINIGCSNDDDCSSLINTCGCSDDALTCTSWTCGPDNTCQQGETMTTCQFGCSLYGGCNDQCQTDDQCDDGNKCTVDKCYTECNFEDCFSGCQNNSLVGCCNNNEDCDDNDHCTDDWCNADGTCGHHLKKFHCTPCNTDAECQFDDYCGGYDYLVHKLSDVCLPDNTCHTTINECGHNCVFSEGICQ